MKIKEIEVLKLKELKEKSKMLKYKRQKRWRLLCSLKRKSREFL
jgi:hypothetical protein